MYISQRINKQTIYSITQLSEIDNEDLLCENTGSCVYRTISYSILWAIELNAKKINTTLVIDGLLYEYVLRDAEFATDFIQFEPVY